MKKLISWGQTGADMAGIEFAIKHGIDFWWSVPNGWRQLDSRGMETDNSAYLGKYPGKFNELGTSSYPVRTRKNVIDSNITLLISDDMSSGGTRLTARCCNELGKPVLAIVPATFESKLRKDPEFAKAASAIFRDYATVNVAGNSEYSSRGIYSRTLTVLEKLLELSRG